jgi:hypothetical protein
MINKRVTKSSTKMVSLTASTFLGLLLVGAFSLIPAANAAVQFNPSSGTGFVGKGDLQTAFGWNNQLAQTNIGSVSFTATSISVTETSWVCTNDRNEQTQERARTTTTETSGIVTQLARTGPQGQVTGVNLMGYSGTPSTSSSTEGPPENSCPSGPWTLTSPAGTPVPVPGAGSTTLTATFGTQSVVLYSAPS